MATQTIANVKALNIESKYYKNTTVKFVRTNKIVNVYQGKIQSKRGKKSYPVFIHHSENMLRMVVIEGLKELTFYGDDFKTTIA